MRLIPRFTLRQLFAGITVIAVVLGVLFPLQRLLSIDPTTEKFESNGSAFEVTWNNAEWHAGHIRVGSPMLLGISTYGPNVVPLRVEQQLFQLSYADYFGNRTFAVRAEFVGRRNSDWTNYALRLSVSGGENVDGTCHLMLAFDPTRRELRIGVKQFIDSKRLAKETELVFVWDGSKFQLRDAPDKASPGSPSEQAAE